MTLEFVGVMKPWQRLLLGFVIGLGLGFDVTFATLVFVKSPRLDRRFESLNRSLDGLRASVDRARDNQQRLGESIQELRLRYDLGDFKIDSRDGGGAEDDNGGEQ